MLENVCPNKFQQKKQKQKTIKTKKYIRNLQNNEIHKKLNLMPQSFYS